MPDDLEALECPVCGGRGARLVFHAENGHPIVRCNHCKVAFTDVRQAPPPSALYPEFEQSEALVPRILRKSLGRFALRRQAIVQGVKPSGRLLDFGCGSGAFAKWMSGAGYDVVGLEPFSLGRPQQKERLLLLREPLEQAAAHLGKFDVITMWHVLEHLQRPVDILKSLSRLLAEDGVLIVSVPNFRSWQSRVFRGNWFHLDPPRHIIHFEEDTLESCLREAGFDPIRHWDFLPEYGSSGWVQSTLNQFLPHSNYLYEAVKDRGALKKLGVGTHALHLTTSVLAGAPILLLSTPLELLASRSGSGAALTIAARMSKPQ